MANPQKRILFRIKGRDTPSSKFRLLVYIPFLEQMGWAINIVDSGGEWKKLRILLKAPEYNLIFIQKKLYSSLFLQLLKWRNPNIIYDLDDALFARGTIKKPFRLLKSGTYFTKKRLQMVLKKAVHVIVGNSFLANYARSFARKVSIIPTPVRLSDYPSKSKEDNGRVIIGWIGTGSNVPYLDLIAEVMKIISVRYPQVEWRVLSDWTFELEGVPIRNIPWDSSTWIEELSRFDIGLMPLTDSDWSRGKCSFKVLQYMAVGIPSVASSVGMNTEVIEDGVTGFLVANDHEWVNRLALLIEDSRLRRSMGDKARASVAEKYTLETCWEQFRVVLESHQRRLAK